MTIHASGTPIKFSEIAAEFGLPSGKNIGAYRVSQTVSGLFNLPLDTGIPQLGAIKFSDFYSKQLNAVVDYTSSAIYAPRSTYKDAVAKYNNGDGVIIIGGFTSKPTLSNITTGMTVWIHTNSSLGSDQTAANAANTNYCSLLTGSWPNIVKLIIDIGPNGLVVGAGGDGGNGGNADNSSVSGGSSGNSGTSALGVVMTSDTTLVNRGKIYAGGGGGGGGGSAYASHRYRAGFRNRYRVTDAGGSGGGGGNGYPSGLGGGAGSAASNGTGSSDPVNGNSGDNGSLLTAGKGGNTNTTGSFQCAVAGGAGGGGAPDGSGGTGGSINQSGYVATASDGGSGSATQGGNGSDGSGSGSNGSASAGGANGGLSGNSIVVSGASISISGSGTRSGNIVYNTTPV
jgi:hypothetical protein